VDQRFHTRDFGFALNSRDDAFGVYARDAGNSLNSPPRVDPGRDLRAMWKRALSKTDKTLAAALKKLQDSSLSCSKKKRSLQKRTAPSQQLYDASVATNVNMGRQAYQSFGQKKVIGTHGVCGCTAVAVISPAGAVVAHVAPNIGTFDGQLRDVSSLLSSNMKGLRNKPLAYLFVPAVGGQIQVPPLQAEVKRTLEATGLVVHQIA